MRRTGMRAAHRIRKISLLLVSFPLDALAEYIPAGTADEPSLQPGDEARRFQEIDSSVGTPLTRSVNSDFLPWMQPAASAGWPVSATLAWWPGGPDACARGDGDWSGDAWPSRMAAAKAFRTCAAPWPAWAPLASRRCQRAG